MAAIRTQHSPAFEAHVAPQAAKQGKAVAELAKRHPAHPAQVGQRKRRLLDGMEALFRGGRRPRRPTTGSSRPISMSDSGGPRWSWPGWKRIGPVKSARSGP